MTDNVTSFYVVWDGDKATFAKAFISAQKGMESVKKASSNPAFKSKYADLSEVVEAVVPALNGAGIGVMQFPAFDGETVSITTVFLHESGASVTGTLDLRPSKTDPQGIGSATTYGRRYSLLAMTGTAPEDDDGNAASGPRQEYRQRPVPQRSASVIAGEAALTACRTVADFDEWGVKNKPLVLAMDAADRSHLLDLWKRGKAEAERAEADLATQEMEVAA